MVQAPLKPSWLAAIPASTALSLSISTGPVRADPTSAKWGANFSPNHTGDFALRSFRLPGGKLTTSLPRTEACDSDSDPEAWRPAPPGRGRRSSGVASASFRVGRSLFSVGWARLGAGSRVNESITPDFAGWMALPSGGEAARGLEKFDPSPKLAVGGGGAVVGRTV